MARQGAALRRRRIDQRLALIERYNLQDNFCWANDYPHHEGSFPYSAQAIERQMDHVDELTRAKTIINELLRD